MNPEDLIALVERLRALPTETEWLEFKRNHAEPQEIGEYLSALANEAGLGNQPRGYLVFGIDDISHDVVGTRFDPYATKAKGNQDLLPWLGARLLPNPRVEGRYPNLIVATAVAKVAGEAGRHIRERGFDKQYYLDLILALVREHAPATRREIDDALISKLPDRLTPEQKQRKVHNLLQELRRARKIDNCGSRGQPAWYFTGEANDG
jgi:hypothetical protein